MILKDTFRNYGSFEKETVANQTQQQLQPPQSSASISRIESRSGTFNSSKQTSASGQTPQSEMKLRNGLEREEKGASLSKEIDGFQAWITLACIFIINANTLGSLKIYGLVFEEIVSQHYYNREEASWPISTASTVQNLAGILTPMLAMKISWRSIEILQTVLIVAANIGAYYSRSLASDIFFLGVIQGLALSLRYNMNVVINNEYFVKYRATAMGVSLAGSTCGVFILKPVISHVLDHSNHQFRKAYLALGILMSLNIILNLIIRKPRVQASAESSRSSFREETFSIQPVPDTNMNQQDRDLDNSSENLHRLVPALLRNPSLHCIWLMQTIYFYISRTYTIFIVDYGVDSGLAREASRDLLEFWVYGEIAGRLLLGGFVDSRMMSLKWNIVVVNLLLALSGYALLFKPTSFKLTESVVVSKQMDSTNIEQGVELGGYFYWYFGVSVALIAALSSLVNMLIVPFGQEYVGKKNVPWVYALGSIVTAGFLLLRPSLIGLSRDHYKSYDLLIIVMSTAPGIYALGFALFEPFLNQRNRNRIVDTNEERGGN